MPEKKGKSAVKSPATPAKGSSPITPPGGSAPKPLVKPDKWWLPPAPPPAPKAPAPVIRAPAPVGRAPFVVPPVQRRGQPSQQPQAQAPSFAQEFSVPDADYGPQLPPPPPMTGVSWSNQPSRYPGIPTPQATVNVLGDLRKPPPGRVPSLTTPSAAGDELDPASFALTLPFLAVAETVKDVAQAPWKIEQAAEDFWKANKQTTARAALADLSRQIDYRPGELSVNKKYGTALDEQKRPPQNIIGEALSRRTGGLVTPEAKLDKDKLLLSGFGGLNMGAALLNPLGTMFLEVPGRAWGAWTVERDRRHGIIDAVARKNELTPEEAGQLNNAMLVRGMPGGGIVPINNPKVKAAAEEIDFGTPIEAVRNVFNELPDGRETFENLSPVEQIVMSVVLAPFDPINVVAGLALGGRAARRVATAQEAFDLSLLRYTDDVPVTELAASGKLFPSGPLDFLLGSRVPQTNVSLAAENALRMTDAMTAGRPVEEVADIFTMYGKFVANDATWADDAARLGMGARALTEKEAALLGTRKGLAMKAGLMGPNVKTGEAAVSVVESKYGRLTAAIIADIAGTPQKRQAVATLLDFVHKGFSPGADALAVTAGEQAAGTLLGRFIGASSDVLGIKAPSSTEQLATALGGAWRSWQGLHSAVQLASPGYVIRNIEGQITDTTIEAALPSLRETLGMMNPDAFKNWWGGRAVGANRGVGAGTRGFEGGNIGGWIGEKTGFNAFRAKLGAKGAPGRLAAGVLGGPATWAGAQENFFSQSIMYKAINQLKSWMWDGGAAMSDTARAGIVTNAGDDVLRRVTGGLDGAIRLDQIDALEGKILGDQLWTVVPPEFSTKFRDYGTVDEVQAFVDTNKNATSAEFASRFDSWIKDRVTKVSAEKNLLSTARDEAALRAELSARGVTGSNLDAQIESRLAFKRNNRAAKELAQLFGDEMSHRVFQATGDDSFVRRAQAMKLEWDAESQNVNTVINADAVELGLGNITKEEFNARTQKAWKDLFDREFQAWSDFIMEANAKLPPDIQADAVAMRQTVEAAIEQAAPAPVSLLDQARQAVEGVDQPSVSFLQRRLRIGRERAESLFKQLMAEQAAPTAPPVAQAVEAVPPAPKTVIPNTVSPPGAPTSLPNIAPGTIDPVVANKLRLMMDESMDYRRFKDFMVANWQTRYGNVTPEGAQAVRTAMAEARQRLREFRVTAENYATVLRDMYLFNYGDKRMLDRVFGGLYSYPYWYTREGLAHVRRAWENPHAMWAMWNAHEQMRALNEDVSVPEWQKTNLNLKTKWGMLSLPLFANFDTTYSFWAPDYKDPIKENDTAGQMYNTLASFGSPHAAIPGIMGILAASQKKDELAYSYAYRLSSGTTLLQAATKGLPGLSDGVVAEALPPLSLLPQNQMMWVPTDTGKVFVGTKADRRRVNMMIEQMVAEDTISPEEAVQVMYIIGNPYDKATANNPDYKKAYQIFRDAVAMAQEARLFQNIDGKVVPGGSFLSWLGGPGLKYSLGAETKIQQSQTAYSQLLDQREAFAAEGEAGMDKWRAAQRKFWSNPENQLYSIYILGNKTGNDLKEAYAWSVVARVGRGYVDDPALKAAGMNMDLLGQFFEAGGIPDRWLSSNAADLQAFMASVFILGSALEMPPYSTVREQDLAGTRRKALTDALDANFFSVEPRLKELYDDYKFGGVNRKELLEQHPELGAVLDFEANFIVEDVVSDKTPVSERPTDKTGQTLIVGPSDGKHVLASYYGSDAIMNRYAWMTFNEENADDKRIYDMAQDLAAIARTGEYPTAKQTSAAFWKDNKAVIDRYKASVAAFKAGLDGYIADLKKKIPIPDPKLPQYREDIAADGYFMGRVDEALTEQEASMSLEADVNVPSVSAPPSTSPYDDALSLIKNDEAKILAEQEAENKRLGYMTGPNHDTYEATLYDTVLAPQGYDPKKAMESFYTVASEGWPVYQTMDSPQELLAFKGDSLHLREKIMTDTTNKWAQVAAYVRTLTPDQLKQLKGEIPDIEWVYAHAQQWDDGPSEAARADIVGVNVSFNVDGTITLSRMSTKEYESGTSDPGKGGAPSGGGTGTGTGAGDGKKKKSTKGIDWNKYYGGEGPTLPGHPRDTGRNYSGGYGGGQEGGYAPRGARQPYVDPQAAEGAALMAEWDTFAGTLAERPDLLVRIQDYFSANETSAQQMLAQFPELALWVSKMTPEQLARLKKAWLVWALQNGKIGSTQATRYEAAMPEFGPTLRYYSRRSGRSGLQG